MSIEKEVETDKINTSDTVQTKNDTDKETIEKFEDISEELYVEAKRKLKELKRTNKTTSIILAVICSFLITGIVFLYFLLSHKPDKTPVIICGVVLFIVFYFLWSLGDSGLKSRYQTIIEVYELKKMQDKVDNNLFESSLKMSYKYLDQYYAQTREQAKKGFLITVAVTIAGAISLFIGIGFMFLDKIDASKISVASGIVVEFISAIMFYFYNKTVQSMGNYHDKLFLSQNIATALKISDSLSEKKRDDIKSQIITELIKDVNAYIVTSSQKDDESNNKKE